MSCEHAFYFWISAFAGMEAGLKRYLRFLRVRLRVIGLSSWVQVVVVFTFLIVAIIWGSHWFWPTSRAPFTAISEPTYARTILEQMLIYQNNNDYDNYMKTYYPQITKQMFDDDIYFIQDAYGYYIPD